MLRKKTISIIGLFGLSLFIVSLARASTISAALIVEWVIVVVVFGILLLLVQFVIQRVKHKPIKVQANHLNPRENDVLLLISEGLTNKQIGTRLHISESTVKKHVTSLFTKLGAKRRTEALQIARSRGYFCD